MPKVICTHRHASDSINGISFHPHKLGRISDEITQEQADVFLSIPGYVNEEGKSAAKIEAHKPLVLDVDKFQNSSFADKLPEMPSTLQESSQGWEQKDKVPESRADAQADDKTETADGAASESSEESSNDTPPAEKAAAKPAAKSASKK